MQRCTSGVGLQPDEGGLWGEILHPGEPAPDRGSGLWGPGDAGDGAEKKPVQAEREMNGNGR